MGVITGHIVGASGPTALPVPTVGQVVESAVALRALTGSASLPAVAMIQYAGSTLLGGGVFVWRTAAGDDDGVTRFNAGGLGSSGAGWQRVLSGSLTLHMGGATGDGVTDDTAAVQRVLDAGAALGLAVHVPIGTYKVTSQLTVTSSVAAPLTLYGDGASSYINSVIAGTDTNAIAASGASFSSATIRDLRVSGTFSRGLSLVAASGSHVRVERCHISGHTAFAGGVTLAAIRFGGLNDVWIVDNVVSGGGYDISGGGTSGIGYDILKDSGAIQSRIRVHGNRVTGANSIIGICLFDVADSSVRGNYVDQGNTPQLVGGNLEFGYGICVYDNVGGAAARRNIIAQNQVRNCAGMGIYLTDEHDVTVVGNVVQNTCQQINEPALPHAAIVLNNAAGTAVGNVIKTTGSGRHGIAWTSPNTAVSGNIIDGVSAGFSPQGDAHRSVVSGNSVSNAVHGLLINGVDPHGITATGNSFTDVQVPLSVQPGATLNGSTFSHNTISGAQVGVYLTAGSNNTIAGNIIRTCSSWGIQVTDARNRIIDNDVQDGTADGGIQVTGNYCRVTGNTAVGNTGTNISVTGVGCVREDNCTSTSVVREWAQEVGALAPGSFTLNDGQWHIQYKRLQLTSTQRLTLAGTARYILTDL